MSATVAGVPTAAAPPPPGPDDRLLPRRPVALAVAGLAGVVPLAGLALMEFGVLGRRRDRRAWLRLHAVFVGVFLVVAHVAMIFGMMDPTVLGWSGDAPGHVH